MSARLQDVYHQVAQLYHWENKSHLDAMMDSACTKTNTFR